jgi:hypothetical protein
VQALFGGGFQKFGGFLECLVTLGHNSFYKCSVVFGDFATY